MLLPDVSLTKKRCEEEIFCLKLKFLVKKRGSYTLYIRFQTVETCRDRQKTYKMVSMTKNRSSDILGGKIEFFHKERSLIRKFGPRNFFPSPKVGQSLRQRQHSFSMENRVTISGPTVKLKDRRSFSKFFSNRAHILRLRT